LASVSANAVPSDVQIDISTQPPAPTAVPAQLTTAPAQPIIAPAPTIGLQTLSPTTVSNTATGSILHPGESWYQDGMEILLDNPTFIPGCKGILGFEMTIINNSG